MTSLSTLDIHIGAWPPSRWDEIDTIRAEHNPNAWGDQPRPGITSEVIDWAGLGFTPRWVGEDSSEAVVALEPSLFHDRGAAEWRRFVGAAQSRHELALAISQVGSAAEPEYRALGGPRAGVMLPGEDTDDETLGDTIRTALGSRCNDIESTEVLARTRHGDLPTRVRERLGIRPGQVNALVRLTLRPLEHTQTDEQANQIRNEVYQALHIGPHLELA